MQRLKNTLLRTLLATATGATLLLSQASAQGGTGAGVGVSPSAQAPSRDQGCMPALPMPPKDPSVDFDWSCSHWGNFNWNGVNGRVFWPSDCQSGGAPSSELRLPLILIMHGDGQAYTDYDSIAHHLSANGFIVASIANSGTNVQRASKAKTYLDFLRDSWGYKDWVDSTNVGLIGHSRGGEAVLTVARLNQSQGWGYDVSAIISLAPTDNQEGGGIPENLAGSSSHALLVIYGTHDEDVTGYCVTGGLPECGTPLVSARSSGFALYDRAGSEGSTEPFPLEDEVVDKTLLYIEGANHNSWLSTCSGNPPLGQLSCYTHTDLAKGYMNAFMRWKLRGMEIYQNYFNGNMKLPEAIRENVVVHTSHQKGYDRRVVDNFEQPGFLFNSIGGLNWRENTVTIEKDGSTWDYEPTSPHDTRSATVSWAPPGLVPYVRFDIPDSATQFGGRSRDITRFDFLSLRAGQVYGSAYNTPGQDKDFYVQLVDSHGFESNRVRVSEFAKLPYPKPVQVLKYGQFIMVTASPMKTIRIPNCRFLGVDRRNISSVKLSMNVTGSTLGELFLDNIEFTD